MGAAVTGAHLEVHLVVGAALGAALGDDLHDGTAERPRMVQVS